MSTLAGVPWFQVPDTWDVVEPFVAKCFDKYGEHRWNPDDILQLLIKKDLQLWLVVEDDAICTVVLTNILCYPRCKELNIFMVSGRRPENWEADVLDNLIEWGKSHGCQYVTSMGRRGFTKMPGWDCRQTYMVRGI